MTRPVNGPCQEGGVRSVLPLPDDLSISRAGCYKFIYAIYFQMLALILRRQACEVCQFVYVTAGQVCQNLNPDDRQSFPRAIRSASARKRRASVSLPKV
jgi:hypothetical protein